MIKKYKVLDKMHGLITVVEHEHGMMMTNAKSDTNGRWVQRGDTFTYEPYKQQYYSRKELNELLDCLVNPLFFVKYIQENNR